MDRVLDGKYRVRALIARGGMGRVYQAEQIPLGRMVALKVLEAGTDNEQARELRQRFMLEAAATSRLSHPHTVRIFDYGQTSEGILYIAMEYLSGTTLHQRIRKHAPLPLDWVIRLTLQMCGSLKEAHVAGLIHRDLKPSNVMLIRHSDSLNEEEDFVKILDFGLVREMSRDVELTRTDAVVGSPSYMSPEQIRGERVDPRSDIYAIGILMYACLTGRPPFTGESSVKVMLAHLHNDPPPIAQRCLAITNAPILEWTVLTCLAKDPKARFASVDDLTRALKVCIAELQGDRPPRPRLIDGRLIMPEDWISPPSTSTSFGNSAMFAGAHTGMSGASMSGLSRAPMGARPPEPAHQDAPAQGSSQVVLQSAAPNLPPAPASENSISSVVAAVRRQQVPLLAGTAMALFTISVVVVAVVVVWFVNREPVNTAAAPIDPAKAAAEGATAASPGAASPGAGSPGAGTPGAGTPGAEARSAPAKETAGTKEAASRTAATKEAASKEAATKEIASKTAASKEPAAQDPVSKDKETAVRAPTPAEPASNEPASPPASGTGEKKSASGDLRDPWED